MINRKIKILSVTAAAILAVVMAHSVNAYWDGGNEDSGGGGGNCKDYDKGANWCKRFKSWYYYEYAPGIDYGDVKVMADGGGFSYDTFSRATSITVGGNCDNYSSGFYVSGIILWDDTKGTTTSSADDVMYGGSSWSGHWIGVAKYDPDNSTYLTLRKPISWYPVDNTPAKNKIQSVTTVPASEVEKAWNSYGRDYKLASLPADATEEQRETAGKLTEWSWFCAGDKAKQQEQYYTGESFIRLTDKADANLTSNTNELASCKSNGSASNTCSKKITNGSGTKRIYYMAAGLVSKDSTKTLTKDYEEFEGTKFDLYNATANNSATAISGTEKDGIEGTIRDVSYHYNYDYGTNYHVAYIDMNPGDKKTICAVNNYHTHYIDGVYEDSKNKVSACIELEYVPYVAAIDSTTALTLNGVRVGDSGADATEDFNYGEENYGYEVITAKWDYLLYSTGRCVENNFHTTYCNPTISTAESFNVGYKRSGKLYMDTDTQKAILTSAEYKYSPGSTTKKYSLLPGETIKAEDTRQGIKHRSGVRMNGDNATGSKDEESSAGFTATAKNAICDINNLGFGLDTNPVNYGRMTISIAGKGSYRYGNGVDASGNATWNDAGPIWLKQDDKVTFGYEACLGSQIVNDKSVSNWTESLNNDAILAVGISGSVLNDTHFNYISNSNKADASLLYTGTGSKYGRHIGASEVIGSTVDQHVSADYQFSMKSSRENAIGHLGSTIESNFGKVGDLDNGNATLSGCPSPHPMHGCFAHAELKIPYNYVLEPSITTHGGDIITIGGKTNFVVKINKNDRKNVQVGDTYSTTDIKPESTTKAKYVTFKLGTNTNYENLVNQSKIFEVMNGNALDNLSGIIHANLTIDDIDSGEIPYDNIKNGTDYSVPVKAEDSTADFNKLCVAVGVYPADSHNRYERAVKDDGTFVYKWDIDDNTQDNALTDGEGLNAFTRITVSCKTVGKYPTMSVEGNGIVSAGDVKGATTNYNNRVFGSWSEYGLEANGVVSLGSGASLAYDISRPQTQKNQMENYEYAGIGKDQFDSPQTLGNIDSAIGLQDSAEASVYIDQMKSFVDNIKSTYFAEKQECGEFLCRIGNTYVNTNYDSKVTIGDFEAAEINSHKDEDAQVFIYSQQDIVIKNEVTQLFANLITDSALDTCEEGDHKTDDARDGTLVDNCSNVLVINGAVYSEGAASLDRVFGGGSPYGSLSLDSGTLVQRAEIFNYDPKIVKWGYDYKHENQPLTTTYIEELSTRY